MPKATYKIQNDGTLRPGLDSTEAGGLASSGLSVSSSFLPWDTQISSSSQEGMKGVGPPVLFGQCWPLWEPVL